MWSVEAFVLWELDVGKGYLAMRMNARSTDMPYHGFGKSERVGVSVE
jgi:hypothetical protein